MATGSDLSAEGYCHYALHTMFCATDRETNGLVPRKHPEKNSGVRSKHLTFIVPGGNGAEGSRATWTKPEGVSEGERANQSKSTSTHFTKRLIDAALKKLRSPRGT